MGSPFVTALLCCQTIWTVDSAGGPGVNFTDIPPAIAAASDGDILLVAAGTYSTFSLTGKGLKILGSAGLGQTLVGSLAAPASSSIAGIPPGSLVYLDRLIFIPSASGSAATLSVSGADTRAILADLGATGPSYTPTGAALKVSGARVHVHRCSIGGGTGGGFSTSGGGLGLSADAISGDSRVHVASSSISGGPAIPCTFSSCNFPGGHAVQFVGSGANVPLLWVAGSSVAGGNGGPPGNPPGGTGPGGDGIQYDSCDLRVSGISGASVLGGNSFISAPLPGFCGPPGVGIRHLGATGSATVHGTTVAGGTGCGGTPGPATSGTAITLGATPLPVLTVTGTLTSTGSATIALSEGPPGAPFVIAAAGSPDLLSPAPPFLGEIVIDPASLFPILTGALSPTGDFSVTIPLAGVAPGSFYAPVLLQGAVLDPSATLWLLSNGTVAVVRP
jgi:hypothetical protein